MLNSIQCCAAATWVFTAEARRPQKNRKAVAESSKHNLEHQTSNIEPFPQSRQGGNFKLLTLNFKLTRIKHISAAW